MTTNEVPTLSREWLDNPDKYDHEFIDARYAAGVIYDAYCKSREDGAKELCELLDLHHQSRIREAIRLTRDQQWIAEPAREGLCDDCHQEYPMPWFAANPLSEGGAPLIDGAIQRLCLRRECLRKSVKNGWLSKTEKHSKRGKFLAGFLTRQRTNKMKLWMLVILGFVIAGMLKDLVYILARKFWRFAIVPIWNIFKPRPGGKLWAAAQVLKGN